MLVLINALEFVTVMINYCAALHVVWTSPITDDPHPVILNVTGNSFRFILDTPHVQAIKIQVSACLFLLFIVD